MFRLQNLKTVGENDSLNDFAIHHCFNELMQKETHITKELICIPTIPQSNNKERKISYAERENFTRTVNNQIIALLATIGTGSVGNEGDPPRCRGRGAKVTTQYFLCLSDSFGFQDRG